MWMTGVAREAQGAVREGGVPGERTEARLKRRAVSTLAMVPLAPSRCHPGVRMSVITEEVEARLFIMSRYS